MIRCAAPVRIWFDTAHLYYMTQFQPVRRELERRGAECRFAFYRREESRAASELAAQRLAIEPVWVASKEEAFELYRREAPDWVVFGIAFSLAKDLPRPTRTAMLYHGIGMKADVYHPSLMGMDVRFVEGPHYTRELLKLYPDARLSEVGYAKTDPLFGPPEDCPRFDLAAAGLDPAKPTLLYAPTFYPSSFPLMADEWPQQLADCNLIVKAHQFSYFNPRCRSHRRKMTIWSRSPNVHVVPPEEYDAVPYMAVSDLMISDASSVLFEFAAQDRPVVWCDFLKLRWTYRGPFKQRFLRRMDGSIRQYADIAAHAARYADLERVVRAELAAPMRFSAARRRHTAELIGKTDGKVSQRIADHLLGVPALV